MHACCNHCCKLVDTQSLTTHISRVLVCHRLSLLAYTRVTNFATFSASGMGSAYPWDGLYMILKLEIKYKTETEIATDRHVKT